MSTLHRPFILIFQSTWATESSECCFFHSANISTLITFSPQRSANALQSSRLIIVPWALSFTSSHKIPARDWPVRAHKSTALSVWPLRVRTPPSRARRGTIWPGRLKSVGREVGEASARAVRLRSCAEMPVVVPVNGNYAFKEIGDMS